jgi:hypothetical protein
LSGHGKAIIDQFLAPPTDWPRKPQAVRYRHVTWCNISFAT